MGTNEKAIYVQCKHSFHMIFVQIYKQQLHHKIIINKTESLHPTSNKERKCLQIIDLILNVVECRSNQSAMTDVHLILECRRLLHRSVTIRV